MKGTILEKIVESKRRRVEQAKAAIDLSELNFMADEVRNRSDSHRLRDALEYRSKLNVIAEFKRASPSKGVINGSVDPVAIAAMYRAGGAAAISVLTEEDHFQGSLDDLRAVRATVDLPILRKDFIFDEYQIYEAAAAGADAILLIAAMLNDDELEHLRSLAEDELGIDALVEVHTLSELERVISIGATLIGVNNRDLQTFHVSLNVSRDLIRHAPQSAVMITESGLRIRDDLEELRELGYSGFLIGETLMRSSDPEDELRTWTTQQNKIDG